jgi:Na+-translocating ferredoxin:NAD+ oxidoreductase RNF subunit RnfB
MNEIIIATVILGGMGLVFGAGLAYASKLFAVEEDELIAKVRSLLPAANCGSCGYAGCDGLAAAIVEGEAEVFACPVGGEAVATAIANALGRDVQVAERMVARVLCSGNCQVTRDKFLYDGLKDCFAASQIFGGYKLCHYGCLGYGNCQRACPFGAIELVRGVAIVNEDLCKACGLCVKACPKKLIEMTPVSTRYLVFCSSREKGAATRKACDVGCIGCGRCLKACAYGAITMDGPLAKIDPCKCTNCGECAKVCPTRAIVKIGDAAAVTPASPESKFAEEPA